MSDDAPALPPVPTFAPEEKVCGNCKLWQAHSVDARGWVGPCRLQPQRGLFPPSAPQCDAFVARGAVVHERPQVHAPAPRPLRNIAPTVVRHSGGGEAVHAEPVHTERPAAAPPRELRRVSAAADPRPSGGPFDFGGGLTMTREELMALFREAAGDAAQPPPLAAKWEGGVVQLIPGKEGLQAKELPIDSLFHKVVMVRDRLRTLEQKLNAHPKLSDAEKVEMQQYITRIYGSLTSFNLLFRDKDDQFTGQKGED